MTVSFAGPFVFNGYQPNAVPPCDEPDTIPGPNIDLACYPGGGTNSATVWSNSAGAWVPVPDRHPGIAAQWNQVWHRVCVVASGAGGIPGPAQLAVDVIDGSLESMAAGLITLIETHDFTGANPAPPGGFTSTMATPAPGGANTWNDQLVFWDAVISGLGSNPLAWWNFFNEPADLPSPDGNWQAQATFWIERTRLFHGNENIIVMDLAAFGQDLGNLASGAYDPWWNSLANHPSGDLTRNVVMGWHGYGIQTAGAGYAGQYTYATMDADIAAAKGRGFPLVVGEYGQAAQPGTGNAGPDAANRAAVDYLVGPSVTQRLVDKHGLLFAVWHGTGDSAFWHVYKLGQGADTNNPTGGPVPQVNGMQIPMWDITAADTALLEDLGLWHGQASGAW